ncbi:MAG TPA: 3'(2'),5'-bisphosphate nucleotidase CysQ [Caulobacteraceae bacterium]|nr:3'(2'),5'-bisphosphate nucleotidase CysQ [Caulobacteraceae bacterium]
MTTTDSFEPPASAASAEIGARLAEMCEAAGRIILPLWRTEVTVEEKSDKSPVTEADQRGEALILEALAKAFPDVPVVAEETVAASGAPTEIARRFFLVDPLDGTKAFVRGEAHFTVNIGLVEDGVPVAGAVSAPATGEVWFTVAGGVLKRQVGERGGTPVRVRPRDPARVLALTSHTLKPEQIESLQKQYGFTERQSMDSSMKLCLIAEGAADVYPRHGPTMEWDVAAAHAVLAAAGGRVTAPDGEPFLYGKVAEGFRNGWFVALGG